MACYPESRARCNKKTVFSKYGDFHYKDKTAVRQPYLYNGNSPTGKKASLYWDGPQVQQILAMSMSDMYVRVYIDNITDVRFPIIASRKVCVLIELINLQKAMVRMKNLSVDLNI